MIKKRMLVLLISIFLLSFTSAWNFQSEFIGNRYVNATYINMTNEPYNDDWINSTIDNKVEIQNSSVVNWANSVFVQIANILDLVGNWSADKVNYYTSSEIDDINTSMKNYVDWNNDSVTNYIASVASIGEPLWTANVSLFNASWLYTYNSTTNDSINNYILSNNNSIVNYIGVQNSSMKNYVDNKVLGSVSGTGSANVIPLWINSSYIGNSSITDGGGAIIINLD